MARPRKPDEVKLIAGTLQNCRVHSHAPKPLYGFYVAPTDLTPAEALAWNQACQLLSETGVLAMSDALAVEDLAVCKARH